MTRAEKNAADFDEFVSEENDVESNFTGLWSRTLRSESKVGLRFILDRLTASFSFEAERITDYAYNVTLPHIVIDFDDEDDEDEPPTKVIFRKWYQASDKIDSGDNVIALFPEIPGTNDIGTCMSYEHFGQHGSASIEIIGRTKPATEAEYADLKRELENQCEYKLQVIKRHRSAFTETRIDQIYKGS